MPNEKKQSEKPLTIDSLRHAEYYGLQDTFDGLYAKSEKGEEFTDLMPLILSRENILLAYRNIKTNAGSKTAGTDKLTICGKRLVCFRLPDSGLSITNLVRLIE